MNFNTLRAELKKIETYICISFHSSTLEWRRLLKSILVEDSNPFIDPVYPAQSIPCLLMPWLLVSPGHQQPYY